jgi:hypothetical protein
LRLSEKLSKEIYIEGRAMTVWDIWLKLAEIELEGP